MEQRLGVLQSKSARERALPVMAVNLEYKMAIAAVVALFILAVACGEMQVHPSTDLADTDLVLVFVLFRHGDRTPDLEELELYASNYKDKNIFFPYGMKALTNTGKQRSYLVGQYIRRRYDGFLSRLYLPDEIKIRTTEYDRTKMTALAALAAIYPPPPAQRWSPLLDWQPVPYDTLPYQEDDLLYWYNCPRYLGVRDLMYEIPEVQATLKPYQSLFSYLSEKTGSNITTPEAVFLLDSLFQTLANVNVQPPKWAEIVMPQVKAMTKIEYAIQTYTDELLRLSTGVLMEEILNATASAVAGNLDQPKMRLYSAHENNVATLMAAAKVFTPHQPHYGATFSIELRKHRITGRYGVTTVYAPSTDRPEVILNVRGCGGGPFCDYNTFLKLTETIPWSYKTFRKNCPVQ